MSVLRPGTLRARFGTGPAARASTVPAWIAIAVCLGVPLPCLAQAPAPSTPGDLTTLFEIGGLVLDTNGDEVPDFVNTSLVTGEMPTPAETRAAATSPSSSPPTTTTKVW